MHVGVGERKLSTGQFVCGQVPYNRHLQATVSPPLCPSTVLQPGGPYCQRERGNGKWGVPGRRKCFPHIAWPGPLPSPLAKRNFSPSGSFLHYLLPGAGFCSPSAVSTKRNLHLRWIQLPNEAANGQLKPQL